MDDTRIFTGRDVDPVSRSKSLADGLCRGAQRDDQVWRREQAAGVLVKPSAQIKLFVGEPAMHMEEAREAVKIQVESAIHQRGFIALSQFDVPARRDRAGNPIDWQAHILDLA